MATTQFTATTPGGRQTVTAIDNQGRPLSIRTDPAVFPYTIEYDPKGRLYRAGQDNNLWIFDYDAGNRLERTTDPMGRPTTYGYDNTDRVNRVTLPSGRMYGFEYDPAGNRTQVIMPNGAVHRLGYSPINLDNAYTPPGNPAYAHFYTTDREWEGTVLPSGRTIGAEYDFAGRFASTTFPEGSTAIVYGDLTDRVSRIVRTNASDNSVQAVDFGYDGPLVTRVAFSGGEFQFAYDNNFFLIATALDNAWSWLERNLDGLPVSHGPFTIARNGPAGAPGRMSDLVSRICGWDNTGLPVACAPGTLEQGYGYDPFGRVDLRAQTVGGIEVYREQLTRDPAGRISRKVETVAGTAQTFDYRYDLDGQLYEVRRDGIVVEQYDYDNNANRNLVVTQNPARNLSPGDFDYSTQDRLGRMGSVSYVFDADGFLASRGADAFTYSARGELLSAGIPGLTVRYDYDGTGRRVSRTFLGGTTQYLYGNLNNPFQVTASRDPQGNLTTYYYDDYGALYALERGGARYYVASDHLGTPKVITYDNGTIIRQVEYDAWGVKTNDTNPSFELPVGFAGGIPDDVTGLVRFGYRDYEPGTGRWAAKDPIFFKSGQLNLFVYNGNDSVNRKDISGLMSEEWKARGNLFIRSIQLIEGGGMLLTPLGLAIGSGGLGGPWVGGIVFTVTSPVMAQGYFETTEAIEGLKEAWNVLHPERDITDDELKQGLNLLLQIQQYNKTQINNGTGYCPLRRKR